MHGDADAMSRYPVIGGDDEVDDLNENFVPLCCLVPESTTDLIDSKDKIAEAQQQDDEFGPIYLSLSKEEDSIPGFVIQGNLLYRKTKETNGAYLRLRLPDKMRLRVMSIYHENILAGHLGQTRTLATFTKRFYWKKMEDHVCQYVRSCVSCQMRKSLPDKPAGMMTCIEVEFPFEKAGMDLLGPFPVTDKGNKYIVVMIEYLTKWVETKALPNGTAKEVALFVAENIVLRYGTPKSVIADRGKSFIGNMTEYLLTLLDIQHLKTTSYHPQTNGLCERFNHTLANMMSMYANTDHKKWDEILPYVTFAYNTSKQESSGYNPFFLLYGREVVLSADIAFQIKMPKLTEEAEYCLQVKELMNKARKTVIENLVVV